MTDHNRIARPYAQALFELAAEADDLAAWSARLDLLAAIAKDLSQRGLLNNPQVTAAQLTDLVQATARQAAPRRVNPAVANLIKLLVHNRRLAALPSIAAAYADLRAEAERVLAAEMITAIKTTASQQKQFTTVLQKKLDRSVKLTFRVDPTLLGGALLRAGDWVIDASVKAQLEQLTHDLVA